MWRRAVLQRAHRLAGRSLRLARKLGPRPRAMMETASWKGQWLRDPKDWSLETRADTSPSVKCTTPTPCTAYVVSLTTTGRAQER